MEANISPTGPDRRPRFAAFIATIAVAAAAPLVGCAPPPSTSTALADWCWAHYDLAPSDALAFDDGPATPADAALWSRWLDATSPAPAARRDAHRRQVELVRRFSAAGRWTETERDDYVDAALSDPTPATACEAVGARIVPATDGSLPDGWERRFGDPADAAWSNAARAQTADS